MATEVPDDLMDLVAKEIEVTRLSLVSINPETRNDGIALINRLLLEHTGDTSDGLLYLHFINFILIFIIYLYYVTLYRIKTY